MSAKAWFTPSWPESAVLPSCMAMMTRVGVVEGCCLPCEYPPYGDWVPGGGAEAQDIMDGEGPIDGGLSGQVGVGWWIAAIFVSSTGDGWVRLDWLV